MVKKGVDDTLTNNKPYSVFHRVLKPGDEELIVHEQAEVRVDNDNIPVRMVGTVQDVTEMKRAEAELRKLSMAIEQSVNIVMMTDYDGRIEYVNPVFLEVTGYSMEETIGENPRILSSGETTEATYKAMWNTIKAGKNWRGEFKNRKKDGSYYWAAATITPIKNELGDVTHFLGIQEDITEKMKAEEKVRYLGTYDELTGLINRARFTEILDEWIEYAGEEKLNTSILLMDVDQFRAINDTYGHTSGDVMLKRIAGELKRVATELDDSFGGDLGREVLVGRIGADEFGLFLPGRTEEEGRASAEVIRKALEGSCADDTPVHVTLSIGTVQHPKDGFSTKELLTKADTALHRAKGMGGNRCHSYKAEDGDLEQMQMRLKGRERIQRGFDEDLFEPFFQPILNLKDGSISHYESLARMREDGKILAPGAFIDTAELFGMVGGIDRVIMSKSMALQALMMKQGREITFSMNLSGKDLVDEELVDYIKNAINDTGADPERIVFEITETAAISELTQAKIFITSLKSLGCKFSLDDFGVGFTSFVYLKELQVDYIKIDGYFIKNLADNPSDQLFVKAIAGVAKGMGIKTIAEFVEKEEALALLREYNIDYAQGYLIGKPEPELLSPGKKFDFTDTPPDPSPKDQEEKPE
ncbi:MAG: EAL domain-containing protein, partial [Thermodesulfobacteriota bacterium]